MQNLKIYFLVQSLHCNIFKVDNKTGLNSNTCYQGLIYMSRDPGAFMPHQWHSGNAQNWKTGGDRFKLQSRLST